LAAPHPHFIAPMTRLDSVLLCAFVLGCGELTHPFEPVATALEYARVGAPEAPVGATMPPTVRVVDGTFEVVGVFGTADPCHTFESRAAVRSEVLIVDVEAVPTSDACVAITAAFAYRVTLSRPLGVDRVVVRHDLRRARAEPVVVQDTTVRTP